jgi:predicted metal-dependent hydrolase
MTFDDDRPQLALFDATELDAPWVVRESRRARRLTVRVFATGAVEVVVPPRTGAQRVRAFVEQHRDWIDARRRYALANPRRVDPFPPRNLDLTAFGERWRVHLAGGVGQPQLRVASPGLLELRGTSVDAPRVRKVFRRWIVERARHALETRLAELARATGLVYSRLAVRRQRTRWGSCSTRGTISLNVCIAFQPPDVARYLMVHELAHTRHMNHSERFWGLVAEHCPGYRALDRQLEEGWRHVPSWMLED